MNNNSAIPTLELNVRLSKDEKRAVTTMAIHEVRYLVSLYYTMQDQRIRSSAQIRALGDNPHDVVSFFESQQSFTEKQIQVALDAYSAADPLGQWAREIVGIGPVIAAGLLAHIDISRTNSAAGLWRWAGLDPTNRWLGRAGADKAMKAVRDAGPITTPEEFAALAHVINRDPVKLTAKLDGLTRTQQISKLAMLPWNAELKVLCAFKLGESFVKVSGNPRDLYGKLYKQRKAQEILKNEAGEFAEQAARALAEKNYNKDTEAYKCMSQGRLSPAHIHRRAVRYAVKIFLSHYWYAGHVLQRNAAPALPYAISHLGHVDEIRPPNLDLLEDLRRKIHG